MAEISTWDELLSTATDETAEIVWMGGDLDFNEIQPHGFTETITFKAKSIDFQNATFKNIRSYPNTFIEIRCKDFRNLSITDAIYTPYTSNINSNFLDCSGTVYNCIFTGEIVPINKTEIISPINTYNFYSCGFNIKSFSEQCAVGGTFSGDSHTKRFIDCRFIFDITQKGAELFSSSTDVMNSLISGKFVDVGDGNVSIGSSKATGTNVYNLEGNFTYTSPKLSVYNSVLATFEQNDNIIACTAEELKNPEILRKKGFPIAVVGT